VVKAPYKDRVEFWKFQHASITFSEATQLCDQIIKQNIISGHPLHTSLMTALHILYGRPFKQRKEVRVSKEIVPHDYRETHGALINMRDQIYAHMDVDGPISTSENSLNKIGVFIKGGTVRFAMTMAFPREGHVEKIRALTKLLSEKTWYHSEKTWRKHFKKQFIPDNHYEVNLSKENDDFLKLICF
jgi:hypothetical protein